jgi:hypothetical protein
VTDPQNPGDQTPPQANQPPPAYTPQPAPPPAYGAAPAYPQQAYPSAPPPAYGAPATATIPGRTMGIVAFILSFFIQLVALILGIIALVQSRRAGHKNGWAVAAIIISSVLIVVGIIVSIVVFAVVLPQVAHTAEEIYRQCQDLGPGVQQINGLSIDCTAVLNR